MRNLLIAEENVTPPTILQLFEDAFMKVELDDDNDVRVTTELGTVILIKVHQDKKMLKYLGLFGFRKTANTSDKLTLVNTLNSKVILSRFSMPKEDILLSEYFLPYEEGIPSYQVINGFRLFERVTLGAIREFDTANLVE
jgi:hypothetical protein